MNIKVDQQIFKAYETDGSQERTTHIEIMTKAKSPR
eukprot:UN07769